MREERIKQILTRLNSLGYYSNPDRVMVKIPKAKEWMGGLLRHILGDKARWGAGYDRVAEWLTDNKGKGLLLCGECGTGKTLICERVLPVLLYNFCEQLILKPFRADELNAREKEAAAAHALLIDDIGTESVKNNFGEKYLVLPSLVDLAERKGKLLILTTNLNKEGLLAKYGERTVDRLRGITEIVNFTGKSFRG